MLHPLVVKLGRRAMLAGRELMGARRLLVLSARGVDGAGHLDRQAAPLAGAGLCAAEHTRGRVARIMPWMRRLPTLLLIAALLPPTAVFAQVARPPSLAQAERNAVELKQGMTTDEVQQLLGKPRRTALKSNGGYANAPSQGTLEWTYAWNGASRSSSMERTLSIEFAAKTAEQWYVNSWGWSNY